MRNVFAGLTLLLTLAIGCGPTVAPTPKLPELRVGMTLNAPPLAFRRGGEPAGLEVDLANALATELGRTLRVVPLRWEEQIAALESGQIDVVMSGMSITRARRARVAFTESYLRSGLAAMTHRADAKRYPTPQAIRNTLSPVGVVSGTTGEAFVREKMARHQIYPYPTVRAGVDDLQARRIDVLIHDIPMVIWFVSLNEGELRVIPKRLNEEHLGWAFRLGDTELRAAADRALARWKQDGTLARVIDTWLPYWSQIE